MIGQTISHYRILEQLGAGGMGVVYRAEDLKLGRVIALKFLAPEFVRDSDSKARFIHEAKAASALDHPNICTIHGIEETDDGRLFIAMACYEGETLKDLISRGPLDIMEAVDIAVQVAQGLAKAHRLGIVHRDIKPANIFLTEDGLVKLLDFGIAKLVGQTQVTRAGALLGTMQYMSPEQLQGEDVDRRTDLWSIGVVLYEMLTGRLPFTGEHQPAILYAILNTEPVPLGESLDDIEPELELAIAKCMRKTVTERYQGVEELLLHLKPLAHTGITQATNARTVGLRTQVDSRNAQPYPGLASFTERETEYFHGRESRVESVWQKLRRGRLLAVTGPSGVGKTSFLRAGLIPAKPADWGVIITTPGGSPLLSLREALVPELADDAEAMRALLRENDLDATVSGIRRWRQRHNEALLILDQFEELFTLSSREEQARIAELLSRLTFEADVHVLVSLRDDFLFHCQEYAGLAPLFESLTVLGPLTGAGLRRALVQPALDCGYAFEDETIVDEMMAEVEGERGALPLLAFATSRLWERRDREKGLLMRQAYEQMGAVSGALAQHAESVMDQIGTERQPIVKELFRNLVTAQGTRAVQDREQLLSVFDHDDRAAAEEVLVLLIDARLLTSYEVKGEDGREHRRIEIVHESLLSVWPRLVRWQTQDADNVQLRDQVRQAAQLWGQRDRSDDLLWTGTVYQEFELWRERYPGGLSAEETEFAAAMRSRNQRRSRRRRIAVASAFVALLAVVAVVGSFGKRAERMARVSEARRFQLLAEKKLEEDNTLALAMAMASLEREDSPETRLLALKALWKAPVRTVLSVPDTLVGWASATLSPDGRWLATVNEDGVLLWPRNGGEPRSLKSEATTVPYQTRNIIFHSDGGYLVATRIPVDRPHRDAHGLQMLTLWSVPDGRWLRTWKNPEPGLCITFPGGKPPNVLVSLYDDPEGSLHWLRYSLESDVPEDLGRLDHGRFSVDLSARFLLYADVNGIYMVSLDSLKTGTPTLIGRHGSEVSAAVWNGERDLIVSSDESGEVRVWSRRSDGGYELDFHQQIIEYKFWVQGFNWSNSQLVYKTIGSDQIGLIERRFPQAAPTLLLPSCSWPGWPSFTPDDAWIVFPWADERFGGGREVFFYSLARRRPSVFRFLPEGSTLRPGFFLADGSGIVAKSIDGELWLCEATRGEPDYRFLWRNPSGPIETYAMDPFGRYLLVNGFYKRDAWLVPVDGSEPFMLEGLEGCLGGVAIDPSGQRVAVGGAYVHMKNMDDEAVIRIHDLQTGAVQVLEAEGECGFYGIWFLPDEQLLSGGNEGLLLWDLRTGGYELLSRRKHMGDGCLDAEQRFLVLGNGPDLILWDLQERIERILPIQSDWPCFPAISPDGSFVVSGTYKGEVFVLPLDSDEPYMLPGHDGPVTALWISPESDEIRTAGTDGTVRIWDVPDGPRTHSLPHAEFLDILRAQTNMRVVTDIDADEGYRIVYDRFPGWEKAPVW